MANTPTLANQIAFAQNNGQGPLNVAPSGAITNQHGETMVLDSSGNLAPAPIAMPPVPGQPPTPPAPPVAPAPPVPPVPPAPSLQPVTPAPSQPAANTSRFSSTENAIQFAQSNGQGNLTVAANGTITNRYGEIMVYDSTGNLAPAPKSQPVSSPGPITTPTSTQTQTQTPTTAAPVVYSNRFSSTEDAIAYAQSNGQGNLTVAVNGTITNRFGEIMVFDSTGNLAPAPKTVAPMGNTPNGPNGAGMPTAPGPNNQASNFSMVPLPAFGSDAYKAILLETGRTDLIGFNYGAHLAVKKETSLPNFSTYINASSGTDLLALLGKVNVNELMASSSPAQVQQLIQKFAKDPAFASYLNTATAAPMPAVNTPAYENLLKETGRTNLDGFDLQAHLKVVTQAQQVMMGTSFTAMNTQDKFKVGSSGNDVIKQSDDPTRFVLIAGDGDDQVLGGVGKDVLIGGAGNDVLDGGIGLDQVVSSATKENIKLSRNGDGSYSVTDKTGAEGVDTIKGVERVHLADASFALDISPTNATGGTALLLATVFGPAAVYNPTYVGIGLSLLDGGKSFDELCGLAINALNLKAPSDVVNLLYTNVVGVAPTNEQAAPIVELLNKGMSPGELTKIAAMLDLTATRINLTGLSETGLEFVPQ